MHGKKARKIEPSQKRLTPHPRKPALLGSIWEGTTISKKGFFADYTRSHWAAIEACVAALPRAPLTDLHHRYLRNTGRFYQYDLEQQKLGNYHTPSQKAKPWAKFAHSLSELRSVLELASRNVYGDDWAALRTMRLSEKIADRIVTELLGSVINPSEIRHKPCTLTFGGFADLMVELEKQAQELANSTYWRRWVPRTMYFQQVLSLWTELGGEMKFSRNAISGEVGGPLVRFFQVVTAPVMRSDSPSLESIPDIIRRQRSYYKILLQQGRAPGL
jgi:hypothetical protein